jgi:hypothetical protein
VCLVARSCFQFENVYIAFLYNSYLSRERSRYILESIHIQPITLASQASPDLVKTYLIMNGGGLVKIDPAKIDHSKGKWLS